jgi:hypothetical protein
MFLVHDSIAFGKLNTAFGKKPRWGFGLGVHLWAVLLAGQGNSLSSFPHLFPMKKILLVLVLGFISSPLFAQQFTEKSFAAFTETFDKAPADYLKTQADAGFVFVGTSGEILDLKATTAICEGAVMENRTSSNLKIRQYGKVAVVTGRSKRTAKLVASGQSVVFDELFTYVFIAENGNWKWASAQHGHAEVKK